MIFRFNYNYLMISEFINMFVFIFFSYKLCSIRIWFVDSYQLFGSFLKERLEKNYSIIMKQI